MHLLPSVQDLTHETRLRVKLAICGLSTFVGGIGTLWYLIAAFTTAAPPERWMVVFPALLILGVFSADALLFRELVTGDSRSE